MSLSISSNTRGKLTARQSTILLLLLSGCELAQIGPRLGCSEKTVHNQLAMAAKRLGLYNKAELIRRACSEQKPGSLDPHQPRWRNADGCH